MKFFLIGDEYTVLGYSLVGINGVIVNNAQEATDALHTVTKDSDVGIILITQRIAAEIRLLVDTTRLEMSTPIVLEIPDRQGPMEDRESALSVVQRLIGIKV
jgi:V/A-type H+/Na+-transporting ATPase subunit F